MRLKLNRRELLEKCMSVGVVTSTASLMPSVLAEAWGRTEAANRPPTPMDQLGPFYKRLAPDGNMMRQPGDPGMPLEVDGVIYSTRGEVIPTARLEIWQTSHIGLYDLEGYRYRAILSANAQGAYNISSVIPGHYPARLCQHVHYLVTAPGFKPLTTQLYFATDPVFEGNPDKNFAKGDAASREIIRPVTLVGDPHEIHAHVQFEIVMEPR